MSGDWAGDYGSGTGPLSVPQDIADDLVRFVLESDLDVAMAERMKLDHGITQPLEVLFGHVAARPTIPIFVNSVALPLRPMRRARLLGGKRWDDSPRSSISAYL